MEEKRSFPKYGISVIQCMLVIYIFYCLADEQIIMTDDCTR